MKHNISLSPNRHDRDSAGLTYVYPVLSRRAKGISIGINLNINNACNWRCVYCQVPDLKRGAAPDIQLDVLEAELKGYLAYARENGFVFADDDGRMWPVVDICFSGNGEPTASPQFAQATESVLALIKEFGLEGKLNLVVISNGSEVYKPAVKGALTQIGQAGGEIWFKLDAGDEAGWARINQTYLSRERVLQHLITASGCLRTRIQTCVFGRDNAGIDLQWMQGYLEFLRSVKTREIMISEVLLYSVARPPQLEEGADITPISSSELQSLANDIAELGFSVQCFSS